MHRNKLLTLLRDYRTRYIDEAAMVAKTRRFVLEHENCFDRKLAHGHISGSAWVVNPGRDHVFLLHHRKLNLWLPPGGHADNNHDIIDVAVSETPEESGAAPARVQLKRDRLINNDLNSD